jgi:hypothetical protein
MPSKVSKKPKSIFNNVSPSPNNWVKGASKADPKQQTEMGKKLKDDRKGKIRK